MVDDNEKVNNVCMAALLVKVGRLFLSSHDLPLYTHYHLPYMLDEALRDFGGVIVHIIALQPIGVSRRAFTHYLDGASPVAQLKHITLTQLQPIPPQGQGSY